MNIYIDLIPRVQNFRLISIVLLIIDSYIFNKYEIKFGLNCWNLEAMDIKVQNNALSNSIDHNYNSNSSLTNLFDVFFGEKKHLCNNV